MEEEIKVGDWISYPVSVGTQTGKVLSAGSEGYDVRVEVGENSTMITFVAKGNRVRKVNPPEEE